MRILGRSFDRWAEQALKGDAASELGRSASSRAGGGSAGLDVSALKQDKAVLEAHFTDVSVYYTAPAEFSREHAEPGAARRGSGSGEAQQIVLAFDLGAARGSRSAGRAASRSSVERDAVSELTQPLPNPPMQGSPCSLSSSRPVRWKNSSPAMANRTEARGARRRPRRPRRT